MRTRRKAGPHGMRETVCGRPRFIKWPDRNPVLGLSRSGPVPRPYHCEDPTPRNPSASCFIDGAVFGWRVRLCSAEPAGRACPVRRSLLIAHGDSPSGSRPPCAFVWIVDRRVRIGAVILGRAWRSRVEGRGSSARLVVDAISSLRHSLRCILLFVGAWRLAFREPAAMREVIPWALLRIRAYLGVARNGPLKTSPA